MQNITVSLSMENLKDAVRDYMSKQGFGASERFSVTVRTIPGDRPFDSDYTEITVSGLTIKGAS